MVRFAAAAIALALSLVGVAANAQQIMLLDFWSPNCGPCMQMKPIVHSYVQAGYPIRQVDTTRDSQTPQQFNVSPIPCFVMLVNGREFERQVGYIGSDGLKQMFDRAKVEVQRQREATRPQSPDQPPARVGPTSRNDAVGPAQEPAQTFSQQKNTLASERPVTDVKPPTSNITAANAKLLAATVRLIVEDAQGRSFGTGTIIDTRSGEALVITCAHLFRESQGKSPVKVEMFETSGDGVRVAGQAIGQLVPGSCDFNRDIALVSIKPQRVVSVAVVAPPRTMIDRGDRAISIGCSNGEDATVLETRVTSLDRYQGAPNIESSGAPAIGRSGGGLFNSRGELIGICNNADPEGNEGIYAGLESIHQELERSGLKEIYTKPTQLAQTSAGPGPASGTTVIRAQEGPITPLPNEPITPSAAVAETDTQAKAAAPRSLDEHEKAALEEIMSRAVDSEVVCIIRPKTPGGQSEVIQLDKVSPEFIQALKQHTAPQSAIR